MSGYRQGYFSVSGIANWRNPSRPPLWKRGGVGAAVFMSLFHARINAAIMVQEDCVTGLRELSEYFFQGEDGSVGPRGIERLDLSFQSFSARQHVGHG